METKEGEQMEHTITERTADNKNEKQNDAECCIRSAIKRKKEGAQPLRLEMHPLNNGAQVPLFHFPLLDQTGVVRHCFTTRYGGVSEGIFSSLNLSFSRGDVTESVEENYRRVAETLGTDNGHLVCSDQTHTTNVRLVTKEDAGKGVICPRDYTDVDGPDHKCFRADTCYFLCRLCTIIFCGSGTPCHRTESFRLAWYSCTYGKMYTGSYA